MRTLFVVQKGPKLLEEPLVVGGLYKDPRRTSRCAISWLQISRGCFSRRDHHLLRRATSVHCFSFVKPTACTQFGHAIFLRVYIHTQVLKV